MWNAYLPCPREAAPFSPSPADFVSPLRSKASKTLTRRRASLSRSIGSKVENAEARSHAAMIGAAFSAVTFSFVKHFCQLSRNWRKSALDCSVSATAFHYIDNIIAKTRGRDASLAQAAAGSAATKIDIAIADQEARAKRRGRDLTCARAMKGHGCLLQYFGCRCVDALILGIAAGREGSAAAMLAYSPIGAAGQLEPAPRPRRAGRLGNDQREIGDEGRVGVEARGEPGRQRLAREAALSAAVAAAKAPCDCKIALITFAAKRRGVN